MPVKHFVVNPKAEKLDKSAIEEVHQWRTQIHDRKYKSVEEIADEVLFEDDNLNAVEGRIVIKINLENKNYHTFEDGKKIRLERQFNNLNRRETEPVNAWVIDGEGIPKGSEILIHHNSIHDSNRVFGYKDKNKWVQYFSIPKEECFFWKNESGKWNAIAPFETALRVFEPYKGPIANIEPTQIKDALYVTSGKLKGNIVKTLKACDYEIIFQSSEGREERMIRFRPDGDEKTKREPEAIAILDEQNVRLYKGELLVGLSPTNCKTIQNI